MKLAITNSLNKKIFLFQIIFLFVFCQSSIAQGINFEPNVNAVFAKAKQLNKMVFIECYHPNCPNCMALEPTLKKKAVGDFYNKNFVSYKLNLSDQNQVKFLTEQKLYMPSFPMFLFFDADKKLIHHGEPQNTENMLVELGQNSLKSELQTGLFKSRYLTGEKNIELLLGCGQLSRITIDTALNKAAMNDLFKIYPTEKLGSVESWLITQKCVTDLNNGFASYWFEHIPAAASICAELGHPNTENNVLGGIIQTSLFSPAAKMFKINDVKKIQRYMQLAGAGEYVDVSTWQAMVFAAENENNQVLAQKTLSDMILKFGANPQALIFIAKFITEETKLDYSAEALSALSMAKPLIKELEYQIKAEYNYEFARRLQKANNLAEAMKIADLSIKNASLAKVDAAKFIELKKTLSK